jgi:hypothetical protein
MSEQAELVTRYTLDDNYSSKLKHISNETNKFAHAAKNAKGATGGGGGGMGGGLMGAFAGLKGAITPITAVIAAITAGVATLGAALVGIGKTAFDSMVAFAPYDTLERQFTAIYGSAAKAKQMMTYLNGEAMKSSFLFTDIAQNAKLLAMSGMKWSDYSDALQGLAMRKGGTGEDLNEASSTLMRLKSGQFGEAFESLRGFGFGRDELTAMGATFDKAGSFTGTIKQALDIFKQIGVQSAGIVAALNGGADATLGNLTESVKLSFAEVGRVVFDSLKGGITDLVGAITDALQSGAIADTVKSIADMFDFSTSQNGMRQLMATLLAGVEAAAAYIKAVWEAIKTFVNHPIIKAILAVLKITSGGGLTGAFNNMIMPEISTVYKNAYDRNMMRFAKYDKDKASGKLNDTEPTALNAVTNQAQSPLQAIAQNTKATADNTKKQVDMSRHVFGGGDIGRVGLTALELDSNGSNAQRRTVDVKVLGLDPDFNRLMEKVLNQALPQLKRAGAI